MWLIQASPLLGIRKLQGCKTCINRSSLRRRLGEEEEEKDQEEEEMKMIRVVSEEKGIAPLPVKVLHVVKSLRVRMRLEDRGLVGSPSYIAKHRGTCACGCVCNIASWGLMWKNVPPIDYV